MSRVLTLTIDVDTVSALDIISQLRSAGLTVSKIASIFGFSRGTIYNRFLSREVYERRRDRKKKMAGSGGTHIVVSKTQASTRRKAKKTQVEDAYWSKEEILQLTKLFGSSWKSVASTVKKHIKKENKSMEVMERLAKDFKGKSASYICKSIINGAYYKAMHAVENDKWIQIQKEMQAKIDEVPPEQKEEVDRIMTDYIIQERILIPSEDVDKTALSDYEMYKTLKCCMSAREVINYFRSLGKEIPDEAKAEVKEYMEELERQEKVLK